MNTTKHYGTDNKGFAAARRNRIIRGVENAAAARRAILYVLNDGTWEDTKTILAEIERTHGFMRTAHGRKPLSESLVRTALRELTDDVRIEKMNRSRYVRQRGHAAHLFGGAGVRKIRYNEYRIVR